MNAFVHERNAKKLPAEPPDSEFTESDLTKLAYWMATGSGKTLILHLNYHQFLHYNREPLDNILLVTPNEGLSEQHLAELQASGIPARRFDLNQSGLWGSAPGTVQVIEITKLVEEKRGGGVSVPVEAFEGHNLIFVDEGHKGSGAKPGASTATRSARPASPSSTAPPSGRRSARRATIPSPPNTARRLSSTTPTTTFTATATARTSAFSTCATRPKKPKPNCFFWATCFRSTSNKQAEALRPYNLEKPLWVFVGSTVNAVYSENKQKRSDVLTVARFLHHVLQNKRGWVVKGIETLLGGQSGLVTSDGMDLFAGHFNHLKETNLTAGQLYTDILKRLFHAPAGGGLHLCAIRAGNGELGLKASGAEDYFGLIYIGDTAEFKKLVEADSSGITLEEDALSPSLFGSINRPDTLIHILIGAKKFMEGWNSWRVSNMGLLNIGRQEGSQIIQLFGRGVRLKGKNLSLKRGAAVSDGHPKHIKLLETLNIFAVRANYMAQFRDYLEREGVDTEPVIELPLFVWANEQLLQKGLVVPRPEEGRDFTAETALLLDADKDIQLRVDLSVKVQTLESSVSGLAEA